MKTILITGFGPFPGAPFNPTAPLVRRLARLRRPALADVKIVPHIFPTSYEAVDRDLPALLQKHKPAALLMFGLAARVRVVRIETRARNSVTPRPDAGGIAPHRRTIAVDGPPARAIPAPARRLLAAVRSSRVPYALSRDAGRYLCNYVSWRAAEAAGGKDGPRIAAFVHVPPVARVARRPAAGRRRITLDDLTRAGARLLAAAACHVSGEKA